VAYVTRILPGRCVSRIISDMDTCPRRVGYVSSQYPRFYYFRNIGYEGLIRIVFVDMARPNNRVAYPSVPDALACDARTTAPRAATLCSDDASPARRPPATSLRPYSPVASAPHATTPRSDGASPARHPPATGDEPPPPLAGLQRRGSRLKGTPVSSSPSPFSISSFSSSPHSRSIRFL
jgi:hypothetical protein